MPAFNGLEMASGRYLFWEHEGNKAVRYENWKLVKQHHKAWKLFDVKNDPTELTDISPQHKSWVEHLILEHEKWEQRCGVIEWGPDMLERWESRIEK